MGQHKVPITMRLKSRAFTTRAILQQEGNLTISEEPYNKGDIVGQHKVPTTMCLKHVQSYNKRGILYIISLYYVASDRYTDTDTHVIKKELVVGQR